MKKAGVMRWLQWCLPWAIFMGILMVNPSLSNAGNISSTDKYAWSENAGWVNFNSTYGSVTVNSDHLEGYAWAENIGWIRLGDSTGGPYNNNSTSDWGVNMDSQGNLSGYAWSENAGWINFHPTHSQVTIGTNTGSFDGYAWGENTGYIHFKNASPAYNVSTTFPPTVTTGSATGVTTNSATLNGTVNANGTSTTAWFQYGVASGSYTGTSTTEAVSGTSATPVSIGISSLSSGTTYYYRIAANNSAGTSTGSEASFTTSSSSGGGGGGGVIEKLTISSTSPSSGATGVSVDSTVSATFSMYIKGSTLTTDTFKLSGGDGDVSGSVSTDGTKATFTPSGKLAYNTEFTGTITTRVAAANAAGTSLESDYSWSFTTESATAKTPTHASTVTPASTPSPTPVASPTPAVTPTRPADMSLSKAVAYLSGDTVAVMVVDADRDVNPTSEDTLTTALKVTALGYYAGGDLILDLKENAVNSGTFLATIKTGTATSGGASVSSRGTVLRAHYYIVSERKRTFWKSARTIFSLPIDNLKI